MSRRSGGRDGGRLPQRARGVAWSYALALASVLPAQRPDPEGAPVPAEQPMLQQAAKDLNAFATLCFKNGFPRRARDTWLEIVAEYDKDDEVARENLGFVRVGAAWQRKPGFEYPDQDTPSASVARMLGGKAEALGEKLAAAHLALGQQLAAAGEATRSEYHFRRALRWAPTDQKAQQAVGVETWEGVSGTPVELALLRRSRSFDRSIAELVERQFPVETVDLRDERLDNAGVSYTAVRSEHFVVFGDHEPEVLREAAVWSERALAFCTEAFAPPPGAGSWPWPPKMPLTTRFAYFKDRATWAGVVEKNASSIPNAKFVVEHTSGCNVGSGKDGIFLSGYPEPPVVHDHSVRRVVQQYSLLRADAMVEGIGHAVVGMFFGRNLIVLAAPEDPSSTATKREAQRFQLPDLEVWRDLARELAFDRAKAPAGKLPLIKAANFTNEERIKAWSFCDYLLRRDPKLLLDLDKVRGKARSEPEVEAEFAAATKLDLRQVEAEWRQFYTGDSAALSAIRNKVTPLEAVSKDAPAWLEQFNRLRVEHKRKPVGWSSSLSTDCRMHVDYLKKNKGERGPEQEHTQDASKPGATTAGRAFAHNALVWTRDRDPKKAMAAWLLVPGYRDAIFDEALDTVGIYADSGIVAMDVARGRVPTGRATVAYFPYANAAGNRYQGQVANAVDVDLLGPEIRALLDKNGRQKQKQIGFPITAHFFGSDGGGVQCSVTVLGKPVDGVLVRGDHGTRRTAASGLWVFWPFEPLDKGKEVHVHWTHAGGGQDVVFTPG